MVVMKDTEEIKRESRDVNGDINNLFKNPNSRSNINGKPALIDPVKAVKTIIPVLKKWLYGRFCVNKPTGAFWNKAPKRISHSKGWIIPDIKVDGLLWVWIYSRLIKAKISLYKHIYFVFCIIWYLGCKLNITVLAYITFI